jgi:hypothetical protein
VPINEGQVDGTELARRLERLYAVVHSQNSSASRPPAITPGGIWSKTVTGGFDVMVYDGTQDVKIGSVINGTPNFTEGALLTTGGTMSGAIDMGNSKITNIDTPTEDGDALAWGEPASVTTLQTNAGTAGAPAITASSDTNTGIFFPTADTIAFAEGGTEVARFDSNGNLGIGTNDPEKRLEVSKNDSGGVFTPGAALSSSTNAALVQASIRNTSADENAESGLLLQTGSSSVAQWTITNQKTASSVGSLIFRSRTGTSTSAERMRIDSSGYLRMASGSGGIQFNGDTDAANALDDYEEGTFTPTVIGLTTGGTGTYGSGGQLGRYTKIGNRVYFNINLSWTAHTGTGNIQINGLPFTSLNLNGAFTALAIRSNNYALTASNYMISSVAPNVTSIAISQLPVGGGGVSAVPLDTAASLMISGHYEV